MGEKNVPPEQLAAKLVDIAEKYKSLQTAAAAQPGDDANITALKAEAQKAIQDGELGKAKEILAKVEKIQDEALDRLALNAAQTAAQLGDVALTQLRYREAAGHFSRAAAKVPQGHEDERWKYLNDEALANQLFTAERDALKALAETPCASDAEFVEKLRYLLAHETRIFDGPPDGNHDFGSLVVAVDRHFKAGP